jgi:hypothetical protein
VNTWRDALDGIERQVDAIEAALDRGDHEVAMGEAPRPDAGPLPAALLPRAEALHARMAAVERRTAERVVARRREVALADRVDIGELARFLDTHW